MRGRIHKRGKRFLLTEEGKTMLPVATELAEKWDLFADFAAAGRTPGLTVACGQEAAGGVVLRAATGFRREFPTARFKVAVARGQRRIEGVAGGLYDVALVTHAPAAIREIARREVAVRELFHDEIVLACAVKSPWSAAFGESLRELTIDELKDWPLALPEADSPIRKQWEEKVRRLIDTPMTVAVEVGGWRVLLGYVLAKFGVGLLPKSLAIEAGAKVKWRPLPHTLRPGNQVRVVTLNPPTNAELVTAFLAGLGLAQVPGETA